MTISTYINNSPTLSKDGTIRDYIALMKPRVMALVVFTSFCGLILAEKQIHPFLALTAIICITMGAGGAAVINMWYDQDIDQIMLRTRNRPLVRKAVDQAEALSFGIILSFFSILLMALCINLLSALLLALTIAFYILIYTMWLKRSSIQNIVIGGVAGALPPVIGMASVDNNISLRSISLFLIIFLWTPPHSWALALYRVTDYKNCNIPMMPVIKGDHYTKISIVFYTILMIVSSFFPFYLNMVGKYYCVINCILNIIFLFYTILLFQDNNIQRAKTLFLYSIFYLFAIFLLLATRPIYNILYN